MLLQTEESQVRPKFVPAYILGILQRDQFKLSVYSAFGEIPVARAWLTFAYRLNEESLVESDLTELKLVYY